MVEVEVWIPAAQQCFDMRLPYDMEASQVFMMMRKLIDELCEGIFLSSEQSLLYCIDLSLFLYGERSLRDWGVQSGHCIMIT